MRIEAWSSGPRSPEKRGYQRGAHDGLQQQRRLLFLRRAAGAIHTNFFARGFQTETIAAFEVAVAQAVTLDATLSVGTVTETVTVQASGMQVESSTRSLARSSTKRQ